MEECVAGKTGDLGEGSEVFLDTGPVLPAYTFGTTSSFNFGMSRMPSWFRSSPSPNLGPNRGSRCVWAILPKNEMVWTSLRGSHLWANCPLRCLVSTDWWWNATMELVLVTGQLIVATASKSQQSFVFCLKKKSLTRVGCVHSLIGSSLDVAG